MKPFDWHAPTKILFGRGRVRELTGLLLKDWRSVLIVTDPVAGVKSGGLNAVRRQIDGRDVFVFDRVEENPSFATIEAGRDAALRSQAEIVIGIGGGSPMDAAKGIAMLAANNGPLPEYIQGRPLEAPPLPVICIPTTSGTGSEVTPYAVFTDRDKGNKVGYSHPGLFPAFSVVDPELTYSMPEALAIHAGLDVLTHALESYLSEASFGLNDAMALHVIETVLENLKAAATKEPQAMDRMAYASMTAGICIIHGGTILLHIMAYPLTVFHGIPHGLANALLLPRFLDFMREKSWVKDKVARLDRFFEPAGGIEAYLENLGVRTGLSRIGVKNDELALFAGKTIVKSDVHITPAPVTEREIVDIYRASL